RRGPGGGHPRQRLGDSAWTPIPYWLDGGADAGARGQLTVRADAGFYSRAFVRACRGARARFSVTVRMNRSLRAAIDAIPDKRPRPASGVGVAAPQPGVQHLAGVGQRGQQRVVAADLAVAEHPALLGQPMGFAHGAVDVDRQVGVQIGA
ncbi:MAG: hypothetical protein M3N52_02230, partial [Actinomycetota bacterium]|nr:hypothetical protein [Actinomycetota bacterium]